jgi:hypothetical protein
MSSLVGYKLLIQSGNNIRYYHKENQSIRLNMRVYKLPMVDGTFLCVPYLLPWYFLPSVLNTQSKIQNLKLMILYYNL